MEHKNNQNILYKNIPFSDITNDKDPKKSKPHQKYVVLFWNFAIGWSKLKGVSASAELEVLQRSVDHIYRPTSIIYI